MTTNVAAEQQHADVAPVDRPHLRAVMRRAGLLVEPSPATLVAAAHSTLTLDEAVAILSRGDGPSFSAELDAERGPNDAC
jgi:hypothetical protein